MAFAVVRKNMSNSTILLCALILLMYTWAFVSKRMDDGSLQGIAPENEASGNHWEARSSPNSLNSKGDIYLAGTPARALIESIKEAARVAIGNSTVEVNEEDLEKWKTRNPCRSRLELMPMYEVRKYARRLPPNPLWDELFTEYSRLHSVCTRIVENFADQLVSESSRPGCQFLVADVASGTGLGNKFLVAVSSLLYAIVTKRVLLVPSSTLLTDITCEPFVGSSWRLDAKKFPVPHFRGGEIRNSPPWTHDSEFFHELDEWATELSPELLNKLNGGLLETTKPLQYAVGVTFVEWQPTNRLYCTAEQIAYSQATWVYMSGCIYTLPKIFATPLFRPTLESLFPDKMVLTRLLRSVFLPSDEVWDRVTRINRGYLSGADRRVGIQVRFKDGKEHYEGMNSLVNERIMSCAHQNGILPRVSTDSGLLKEPSRVPSSSNVTTIKVFMASLFPGLQDHLSNIYVRNPTLSGEDVTLVQISQDREQAFNSLDEDRQAFTEVLLLSLSDQLIVTPLSTFGGVAQGYGALTPWFVEMRREENLQPCQRGQTVDVCNQFANKHYQCAYDAEVGEKSFSSVVPYIKDCLEIDHSGGIQLITDFQS